MTLITGTPFSENPRDLILNRAKGIICENQSLFGAVHGSTQPATQVVYGYAFGLAAGDVVTGIAFATQTAASGTNPTTIRAGLANSTGTMVAVSGNVNTTAFQALGIASLAVSYTVPTSGLYYGCYVVNGTWGTTQALLWRGETTGTSIITALGSNPIPAFIWTGQTDLPTVGNPLTLTTTVNFGFYMAIAGTPV